MVHVFVTTFAGGASPAVSFVVADNAVLATQGALHEFDHFEKVPENVWYMRSVDLPEAVEKEISASSVEGTLLNTSDRSPITVASALRYAREEYGWMMSGVEKAALSRVAVKLENLMFE